MQRIDENEDRVHTRGDRKMMHARDLYSHQYLPFLHDEHHVSNFFGINHTYLLQYTAQRRGRQ